MKWKAIIFDRDGTLFDSLPVILRAFNYGIEPFTEAHPSDAEWFSAFGPHEPEVMGTFIPAEHKESAYKRFLQYYCNHFREISLYPGMKSILDRSYRSGIKLALFTGAGKETAEYSLKNEDILQYFSELITGDSVLNPKPHPEGILKAMSSLNIEPTETLVVGDAGADVLAGQAAGATTVLARWSSFTPPHDLPSSPDYTFTAIPDFYSFLFSEPLR